jgi:predicted NAD-dependent protein-ADP-ribosyltransferase YbiA (DUF1768 family)
MTDENKKTFTPLHWLGNMSPCKIIYNDEEWDSAEKLFQAMRFNDECIRQKIRNEKGIFKSNLLVSNLSIYTVVEPMSSLDIENLRTAMQLKFDQNKILQLKLLSTDNINLVLFLKKHYDPEDLFWGMTIIDEQWIGMNIVGKILMEIRAKIKYFNN